MKERDTFFCLLDYKNELLHFVATKNRVDRNISKIIFRDGISQLQIYGDYLVVNVSRTITRFCRLWDAKCYFITRENSFHFNALMHLQEWLRNTWRCDLTILLTRSKLDDNNIRSCMRIQHDEYRYSRILRGIRTGTRVYWIPRRKFDRIRMLPHNTRRNTLKLYVGEFSVHAHVITKFPKRVLVYRDRKRR